MKTASVLSTISLLVSFPIPTSYSTLIDESLEEDELEEERRRCSGNSAINYRRSALRARERALGEFVW